LRIDLGLTESEAWALVPYEMASLLERYDAMEKRADLRTGILASLLCNMFKQPGARSVKPQEFILVKQPPETPQARAKRLRDKWLGIKQTLGMK